MVPARSPLSFRLLSQTSNSGHEYRLAQVHGRDLSFVPMGSGRTLLSVSHNGTGHRNRPHAGGAGNAEGVGSCIHHGTAACPATRTRASCVDPEASSSDGGASARARTLSSPERPPISWGSTLILRRTPWSCAWTRRRTSRPSSGSKAGFGSPIDGPWEARPTSTIVTGPPPFSLP